MRTSPNFDPWWQVFDPKRARFLAEAVEHLSRSANQRGQKEELDNEADKLITSSLLELAKAKGYLSNPEKRQRLFAETGKQVLRDQALDDLHASQTSAFERAKKKINAPAPNAAKILRQLCDDLNVAWKEYQADPSVSADNS